MQTLLKIVFALAAVWTISACTAMMNDAGVALDTQRKQTIGR